MLVFALIVYIFSILFLSSRPHVIRATVEGKKLGPESLGGRVGTGTQAPSPVQASVCKDWVARTARRLWGMQLLRPCVGFLGGLTARDAAKQGPSER